MSYTPEPTGYEAGPCPVEITLRLISNKWKIFILRDLLESDLFFGELRRSVTGISPKVLTENLRAMEADGIILREELPGRVSKVRYKLSPLGESMRPVIAAMQAWGTGYLKERPADPVSGQEAGQND